MNQRIRINLAVLAMVALNAFAVGQQPSANSVASDRLGAPIQLFSGKDLGGWVWVQQAARAGAPVTAPSAIGDVWSVRDGILHCKGSPTGYIRTEKEFPGNFVLKVEQRHINRGNGGVLFAMTGPDKVWPRSLECQGQTGDEGDIRGISDFKLTMDPARSESRRLRKIGPSSEKQVGEWETIEVIVDHGSLTIMVNGQIQNVATSTESLAGKIGLQSEGGEMEFRKIEFTPIEK